MGQNIASIHLTPEQWAQIDDAVVVVTGVLEPALVPLTPTRKRGSPKMGDGSQAFCRLALQIAEENPALIPPRIDLEEMRRDLDSHDALKQRAVKLTALLEKVRDTQIALGSDVMVAALEIYAVLKAVGKAEGVHALRKQLSKRFDKGPHEGEPEPIVE